MFPKKGTIAVGSDADIVIFDTEKEHTFMLDAQHMNVDYCAYEGKTIKGKVETVLVARSRRHRKRRVSGRKRQREFIERGECVKI